MMPSDPANFDLAYLDPIYLLLVAAVGAGTGFWLYYRRTQDLRERLSEANRELEELQRTFNQFAPPRVVDDILKKRSLDIAETREATILFADLRGFAAMSEQMAPSDIVKFLNRYFRRMERAVEKHDGFISKFIGDGLLVLFGTLHHNPWQSTDAVKAALDMRQQAQDLDSSIDASQLPPLSLSIGIHRGPVVAGIMGSLEMKEFTVVGRHVNLASRVEGLTREHGADILITRAVKEELDPSISLTEQPPRPVKGMEEPVRTFAVRTGGTEQRSEEVER